MDFTNREAVLERIESYKPWYQNIWLEDDLLIKGHGGCGDPALPHVYSVLTKEIKGARILDLGSNAGIHAIRFAQKGAKQIVCIEALEMYHKQFSFVRGYIDRQLELPIKYVKGYVEEISDLVSGKFDIILALAILYHIGKMTVPGRRKEGIKKEREKVVKSLCELSCGNIVVRERKEEDMLLDDEEFAKYNFYCVNRTKKSRIISCYMKS